LDNGSAFRADEFKEFLDGCGERAAAQKALIAIGNRAYKLMREAAMNMDAEIKRRAEIILKEYEKQMRASMMAALRLAAKKGVLDAYIEWYKKWWKTYGFLAMMVGLPWRDGPFGPDYSNVFPPP
jgi:hypothetical protein